MRNCINLCYLQDFGLVKLVACNGEDIDFSNRFIYVKRTLSYQYEDGKKTMRLTSPKTENSVRKVPFLEKHKRYLSNNLRKSEKEEKGFGRSLEKTRGNGKLGISDVNGLSNRKI